MLLHVFGGVALAAVVLGLGGAYVVHVAREVGAAMPATTRASTAKAGRSARQHVVEPVRNIRARARAEAKWSNWLERKRAKRSAAALRAPRQPGSVIRRMVTPKGSPSLARPQPVAPVPKPAEVPVAVNGTASQQARHLSAVPGPQSSTGNGRIPTVTIPSGTPAGGNGAPAGSGGTSAGGGYGAGADLLSSVQHLVAHVLAGGIQAKQRGYAVMGESFDYMADQFTSLASRMAEPDQNYPASAWEPWLIVAAHLKAAANAGGEGASVIQSIRAMTVGELAESSVKAPHHEELNKA